MCNRYESIKFKNSDLPTSKEQKGLICSSMIFCEEIPLTGSHCQPSLLKKLKLHFIKKGNYTTSRSEPNTWLILTKIG